MRGFLESFFKVKEHNSTLRTELLGGLATFLTLSYIIFVNPAVLTQAVSGLVPGTALYNSYFGAFLVATVIGGASATLMMGLVANYPFALAPGMGINAYFTYTVCIKMGIEWRAALGAVFVESLVFAFLTIIGLRAFIVNAVPSVIKFATCAGIGLFLALIGLKGSHLVVADPNTLVTLGNLTSPEARTTIIGLIAIAALHAYRIPGSIVIGIIAATIYGWFVGISHFQGIIGPVPDISATFMQFKVSFQDLINPTFWIVVFTLFFADFFDTAGTLTGLSNASGLADKDGNLPRATPAFMADAVGTFLGAIFGTSAITAYVESGAGIAQGARTGLAAVVVAILMLASLFFAPLAMSVPAAATAPALIFVGSLMMLTINDIKWHDVTEALPAFITIVAMPFTFSIANGIALGMISYLLVKIFSGKLREITLPTAGIGVLFLAYFAFFRH